MEATNIKKLIDLIRKKMPRYGIEKLHLDINGDLQKQGIKMGRDKFLKFARQHPLLVPKTKRYFITTESNHMFNRPPNRIKNLEITQAEQAYVSDIAYIKLDENTPI